MLIFTLAISCLTTSNLPWLMDLTFQVPMQYCSYSIRPCFYHQSHPQLGIVLLWFYLFILSGVTSPLISSSILGTYRPGEFIFQCPIFLRFHTIHGVPKARILKWFAIPFSSEPHFVKFGKLSSGHRTGKRQFHSNPKERQCQTMLKLPHNCTHLTC